jgi:hypothetical protein
MTTIRTQRFTVVTKWTDGSTSTQGPFDLGRATEVKRRAEKHPDAAVVIITDSMAVIAA